ncbi:hypothetical protein GH733_015207 [Mirounga leonina]|nr:hypothetical protein GH733_015207 [Mirounga leonina]
MALCHVGWAFTMVQSPFLGVPEPWKLLKKFMCLFLCLLSCPDRAATLSLSPCTGSTNRSMAVTPRLTGMQEKKLQNYFGGK